MASLVDRELARYWSSCRAMRKAMAMGDMSAAEDAAVELEAISLHSENASLRARAAAAIPAAFIDDEKNDLPDRAEKPTQG